MKRKEKKKKKKQFSTQNTVKMRVILVMFLVRLKAMVWKFVFSINSVNSVNIKERLSLVWVSVFTRTVSEFWLSVVCCLLSVVCFILFFLHLLTVCLFYFLVILIGFCMDFDEISMMKFDFNMDL